MIDTRTILSAVGALAVGSLLLAAGYYIRGAQMPDDRRAPPDTDSVATADPDTSADVWLPDVLTVYDTVRTDSLVRDTVWLPAGYDLAGCFQGEPMRRETPLIGPDRYTLTYFDPNARRFKQKTYTAERPTWALWPAVEIRTTPWGLQASTEMGLRWRDWTLTGGYVFAREHRGVTVGLRWRPLTVTP